ncbi:MAG: hypothetical protein U9N07_00145 [Euryarchaeota archaeon]|nr:hypothetical protein [Euryarchaeota archaeon]
MERDLIKEAYSKEKAWGLSAAIDIHGCNPEKIQDEAEIKRFIYVLPSARTSLRQRMQNTTIY